MSGITGILHFTRDLTEPALGNSELLADMAGAIAHRGGKAHHVWMSAHACFARLAGHTERTVYTLRKGDAQYAVTCDSLLADTAALRLRLSAAGYCFETQDDAELILAAYLQYGEDCATQLSGGFAFALFDGARQCVIVARDPMGTRPFFYTIADQHVLFGSEMKALFAHPACTPAIDDTSLCEVLGIGPGRSPGSGVFHGMQELSPGQMARIDADGIHPRVYWQLTSHEHTETVADTVAHTRELVLAAIRRQLVGDTPMCSLLSGGLDSSVITAVAAEHALGPLPTYSFEYVDNAAHFTGTSFQPEMDAPYVQMVHEHCGTAHTILQLDSDLLPGALPAAMRARDLPGMGDIDASLLLFCEQLAQRHTIALSGECADEVFGGYPWFHRPEYLAADTFPWNTDPAARRKALCPALVASLKLDAYVAARYEDLRGATPRLDGEAAEDARRREIAYLNLYGFMQTLVDRGDRMSMAHHVEIRTPFADPELVRYIFNVPWRIKALGGEPKGLLRAAAEGLLPAEVLHRKKCPFPKTHHPHYEQLVQRQVLDVLDDARSPVLPLLDTAAVRALCAGHADYGKPWFGQLMAGPQLLAWILQLNAWLTTYHLTV